MENRPLLTTTLLLFPLLVLLLSSTASHAHNITRILAKHPEFSTFNHYLTVTHLAAEINRRQTITVLALDNSAMSSLLSKQLSVSTLRNVLSLHVLTDYFGSKKLHQITNGTALTSSMFQATGSAPGSSGYVNVTDLKGGKVGFGAEDNDGKLDATYVKSVAEFPYNISVLQISQVLNSDEAEAPTAGPSGLNLTAIMAKQGCKAFADLLIATGAHATFEENLDGGLTVFCPTDAVVNDFMPKYKNLTEAHKVSLLLYHGTPVYQSLQTLKSSNGVMPESTVNIESPHKQLIRTNVPTSEQIASLNLKDGQNMITFSFSTRVLGTQQVEAHLYLWKWNAKIVISDVDGTITKSDVLGQFMPLVGKDWTQSGVAKLFSAIKENGYQLLFLSARAIVQAYLTRSFLLNLKQDGNALPNGPVVISPDGLFPSLFREVIRRAPHEFKIACLEDIKKLFPSDYNPFYAGFGNRDTDELSYRKIGIPKGKIFIINPKGEVAISHRIDVKSYTSLHTLVNDMFPPTSLVEQEDYNSWNFWRIPLLEIEI